ncbi:hypothetical protein [Rubrolithibacter danxiaensis]|uniref:hypothetical protein n=1 Tax=Rubrolithibacter danxiaensis TaxID=3390805 RepID=UPI003BF8D1A1
MKLLFMLLLPLSVLIHSCKKDDAGKKTDKVITVKSVAIKANQEYRVELSFFGYEDGAIVSNPPLHASKSELSRDVNSNAIYYVYIPSIDFVGADEVEIKSMRGSGGASTPSDISFTRIKFTVTP